MTEWESRSLNKKSQKSLSYIVSDLRRAVAPAEACWQLHFISDIFHCFAFVLKTIDDRPTQRPPTRPARTSKPEAQTGIQYIIYYNILINSSVFCIAQQRQPKAAVIVQCSYFAAWTLKDISVSAHGCSFLTAVRCTAAKFNKFLTSGAVCCVDK